VRRLVCRKSLFMLTKRYRCFKWCFHESFWLGLGSGLGLYIECLSEYSGIRGFHGPSMLAVGYYGGRYTISYPISSLNESS
jgi:hypothetical protein